jgi:hypothetical protein
MQLLEVPLDLQPNATAYDAALFTFSLLAVALHEGQPQLLLALFGTNHNVSNLAQPYASYFLLHYDRAQQNVFGNYSLSLNCSISCSVKASPSFLLLETHSQIQLYPMLTDRKTINIASPLLIQSKTWTANSTVRYQSADIYDSSFAYCDGANLYFMKYTPGNGTTSLFFTLPLPRPPLSILLTRTRTLLALHTTPQPMVLLVECTACVFAYTFTSGSAMPSTMYRVLAYPGSPSVRFSFTLADSSLQQGQLSAAWALLDSSLITFTFDNSTLALTAQSSTSIGIVGKLSTNYEKGMVVYGSSSIALRDYNLTSAYTVVNLDSVVS